MFDRCIKVPMALFLQAALQQLDARMQRFIPAFEQLVVLVQNRVRYPETLEKMRKDEIADFRRSRYSTADVLEDAAGGARHDLLHLITCMAVPSQRHASRSLPARALSSTGQHAAAACTHALLTPSKMLPR